MYVPSDESDDLSEIDVSSAIRFMERNHLGRLNLTIEAVGLDERELVDPQTLVTMLERLTLTDNETPSPEGLNGVFFVYEVESDG